MYHTKEEREKYYEEKLATVKRKETRQYAKLFIDMQDDSIKSFVQALMVAEYHVYDQAVLDKLYRKYLKEANFEGILHPNFKEWLDEIANEEPESTENSALADAILEKNSKKSLEIALFYLTLKKNVL